MNDTQRSKLGAGAGLATVLLGALMVLAPGAGADDHEEGDPPAGQNPAAECAEAFTELLGEVPDSYWGAKWNGNPDYTDQAESESYNGLTGTASATAGDGSVTVSYEVNKDVVVAIVKQGQLDKEVIELDGSGEFVFTLDDDLSHFSLCGYDEPEDPEASLTVVKLLSDEDPEATFPFELDDVAFDAELGHEDSDSFSTLAPGTYTVSEQSGAGHSLTSIVCIDDADESETPTPLGDADGVTVNLAGESVTVVLDEDDSVTCTFTNTPVTGGGGGGGGITPTPEPTPEPEAVPASLQVVKVADGAVPDAWSADFDVALDGGVVREILLDQTQGTSSREDIDAGTYTITESIDDDSTLASVACVDGAGADVATGSDLDARTVTVALAEDADVTCTFTNAYEVAEVLPIEDEPEPLVEPEVEEELEVLGDVVVRSLPRTGGETTPMAGAGALLVALGAAMVLASRRQLARE